MNLVGRIVMVLTLVVSILLCQAREIEPLTSSITSVELLGQWRVKEITYSELPDDKDNLFTSYRMHQGIVRYEFKVNDEFTFVVPNKKKNRPEDGKYWTWSFDQMNQKIEIKQTSLQNPPFNFGVTATIKQVKEYKAYKEIILEVIFHADNTSALLTLSNLIDSNWDLPPLISDNLQ